MQIKTSYDDVYVTNSNGNLSAVTSLDFGGANVSLSGSSFFKGMTSLTSVTNGIVSATSFSNLFSGCTNLKECNITTPNATYATSFFRGCSSLEFAKLYIPSVPYEQNARYVCSGCTSLNTLQVFYKNGDYGYTPSVSNLNLSNSPCSANTIGLGNYVDDSDVSDLKLIVFSNDIGYTFPVKPTFTGYDYSTYYEKYFMTISNYSKYSVINLKHNVEYDLTDLPNRSDGGTITLSYGSGEGDCKIRIHVGNTPLYSPMTEKTYQNTNVLVNYVDGFATTEEEY